MSKKIISSVLFDFDGVLIDSLPAMEIAWNSVRSKYKIKNGFDQYKKFIGLPFQKILEELEIDSSKKDLVKKYYSKITSENIDLIKLNPYAENLLLWLSAHSISTGIVTSKDKLRTYELIEYFQLNIQSIVTPESTNFGKPSSEPILYAAKELNTNVNEILFVGDMISDMKTAINSKCQYLHYLNGYQKLKNQEYGGQITSLLEIIEYIENI